MEENVSIINAGAVIVLFKPNLRKVLEKIIFLQLHYKFVLVYDNSPSPAIDLKKFGDNIHYVNNVENGGTYAAYMEGVGLAQIKAVQYLSLFDQDSVVDLKFISALRCSLDLNQGASPLVLIPEVLDQFSETISPTYNLYGWITACWLGRWFGNISAISSGSTHDVEWLNLALSKVANFWLDYLDHSIFYFYYKSKKVKIVLINNIVEHDLSISQKNEVSDWRMDSIFKSEYEFAVLQGKFAKFLWRLRRRQ